MYYTFILHKKVYPFLQTYNTLLLYNYYKLKCVINNHSKIYFRIRYRPDDDPTTVQWKTADPQAHNAWRARYALSL